MACKSRRYGPQPSALVAPGERWAYGPFLSRPLSCPLENLRPLESQGLTLVSLKELGTDQVWSCKLHQQRPLAHRCSTSWPGWQGLLNRGLALQAETE